MFSGSKKFVVITAFTVLLIAAVNLVWWFNYSRTEELLEKQLSRRLASIAQAGAASMEPELLEGLIVGDFDAYARSSRMLENLREADSLSELFVIDEDHAYLVTTLLEPEPSYFLTAINGTYIDSLFFGLGEEVVVTESYRTGGLYLKSAFAPLFDREGYLMAVLGVEANVDYFEALDDLKENLYLSTLLSVIGGLLLGIVFLLLQQRINRAEQQLYLGQTQAYLGRMVAVVAHEVKNPLMIIRASGERLVKKTGAEEAGFVVEEIDRLNEIVSGYLDFARGDASLLSNETPVEYDLSELLREIARQIGEKYAPDPVKWSKFTLPDSIVIHGFRRSVRQVVFNLLTNGAEACLACSKPVTLGMVLTKDANRILLEIRDEGCGIDRKDLSRLFTPFLTTKQTGSGLGLYLSRRLVKEMGGKLNVSSAKGQGTNIMIELPHKAAGNG